jgi:hypothetical protein
VYCQFGELAAGLTAFKKDSMGRIYAGILGPLAMAIVIGRGLLGSGGVEGTLTTATLALATFAILGAILGHLAQNTIDESVRARLELQLAQHAVASPAKEALG